MKDNIDKKELQEFAKAITRSNIIIFFLYDLVENYFKIKTNETIGENKNFEDVKEIEKIVKFVKDINFKRKEAKKENKNLVIDFKLNNNETDIKNNSENVLEVDFKKLQELASNSEYKPVIDTWFFCLKLIENKKYTDELYNELYELSFNKNFHEESNEIMNQEIDQENLVLNIPNLVDTIYTNQKLPKKRINYLKNNYALLS